MGWIIIGVYAIGWMVTFRTVFLSERDKLQRKRYYNTGDDITILLSVLFATFWMALIGFFVFRFIMFPRGIKTKYDREQELKRNEEEAQRALEKAYAVLAQAEKSVDSRTEDHG